MGDEADWITGDFKKPATRDFSPNEWEETALSFWFQACRNNGEGVGSTWGFHRGSGPLFILNSPWRALHPSVEAAEHDKKCLETLFLTREQQLKALCQPHGAQENITDVTTSILEVTPPQILTRRPSNTESPSTTALAEPTFFQQQPNSLTRKNTHQSSNTTTSSCCVIC